MWLAGCVRLPTCGTKVFGSSWRAILHATLSEAGLGSIFVGSTGLYISFCRLEEKRTDSIGYRDISGGSTLPSENPVQ